MEHKPPQTAPVILGPPLFPYCNHLSLMLYMILHISILMLFFLIHIPNPISVTKTMLASFVNCCQFLVNMPQRLAGSLIIVWHSLVRLRRVAFPQFT